MYFLVLGALIGLFGAFQMLLRPRGSIRSFIIWWAVTALFWTFACWLFPFQLVGPLGGFTLQIMLLVQFGFVAVFSGATGVIFDQELGYWKARPWYATANSAFYGFAGLAALMLATWFFTTSGMLHSDDYRVLVGESVKQGEWDK